MDIKYVFHSLRLIVIVFATALFSIFLIKTWNDYMLKTTDFASSTRNFLTLKLPAITVCSIPGWKTQLGNWTREEYLDNVFTLEETFAPETDKRITNTSEFAIKKTYNWYFGLCHTLVRLKEESFEQQLLNHRPIHVTKKRDINIFVHEPGEEFWISMSLFINELGNTHIDANNSDGNTASVVLIRKVETSRLTSDKFKCEDITNSELVSCLRTRVRAKLAVSGIRCVMFFMDDLGLDPDLPHCIAEDDALEAVEILSKILTNQLFEPECPEPCFTAQYYTQVVPIQELMVTPFVKNFLVKEYFSLFPRYANHHIHTLNERYLYDFSSALVAIGGYLGLFLGISCLSLGLDFLNGMEKLIQAKKQSHQQHS